MQLGRISRARLGSAQHNDICFESATAEPAGTIQPFFSSVMASAAPTLGVTIAGIPAANASTTTIPKDSIREGSTRQSMTFNSCANSRRLSFPCITTLSDGCSINREADPGSPMTCNSTDGNAPDVILNASNRTSNPFLLDAVPTNTNFVGPLRFAPPSGRNKSTSTPSELTTIR